LSWALANAEEDLKQEVEKIKAVIDALKPWLNFDLYKAEEKQKKTEVTVSTTYLDELRARGATEESLAETKKMMGNLKTSEPPASDDDDGISVIPL
jgi:hypothetical protein